MNSTEIRDDIRYMHYLWDHGYDPIGAGDLIRDALAWLRMQSPEWLSANTVEAWHEAFLTVEGSPRG